MLFAEGLAVAKMADWRPNLSLAKNNDPVFLYLLGGFLSATFDAYQATNFSGYRESGVFSAIFSALTVSISASSLAFGAGLYSHIQNAAFKRLSKRAPDTPLGSVSLVREKPGRSDLKGNSLRKWLKTFQFFLAGTSISLETLTGYFTGRNEPFAESVSYGLSKIFLALLFSSVSIPVLEGLYVYLSSVKRDSIRSQVSFKDALSEASASVGGASPIRLLLLPCIVGCTTFLAGSLLFCRRIKVNFHYSN